MIDKYLYFIFDGINSSDYKCYYENSGEDLVYPAYPQFSDSTSEPLFQPRSYYLGTSVGNRTFNFKCVCEDVSLSEWRKIQKWLAIDKIGKLNLPFIYYYHWVVKVSSIGNILLLPLNKLKTAFHCEFDLSFTTIEDNAAISDIDYHIELNNKNIEYLEELHKLIDKDYLLPLIDLNPLLTKITNPDTVKFRLFNYQSCGYYPTLIANGTNNYKVALFDKDHYEMDTANDKKGPLIWYYYQLDKYNSDEKNLKINSELGYVLNINDENDIKLIEQDFLDALQLNPEYFYNKGSFEIPYSPINQEHMTLINTSFVQVPKGNDDQTLNGLQLTFRARSSNALKEFDYGTIDEENIIVENENWKAIFIQPNELKDYLFYNEGGYSEGPYYVDDQEYQFSYFFDVSGSTLRVVLVGDNDQLAHWREKFNSQINEDFLVSITNYTQIEVTNLFKLNENTTTIKSNLLDFNLRTMF